MDLPPSGGGTVSLHFPRRKRPHPVTPPKDDSPESGCSPPLRPAVLSSGGLTHRPFFSATYLLLAPDVTRDPFQNQIQLGPVPHLVVVKLNLPFAGPAGRRSLLSHPGCLAGRRERKHFSWSQFAEQCARHSSRRASRKVAESQSPGTSALNRLN